MQYMGGKNYSFFCFVLYGTFYLNPVIIYNKNFRIFYCIDLLQKYKAQVLINLECLKSPDIDISIENVNVHNTLYRVFAN